MNRPTCRKAQFEAERVQRSEASRIAPVIRRNTWLHPSNLLVREPLGASGERVFELRKNLIKRLDLLLENIDWTPPGMSASRYDLIVCACGKRQFLARDVAHHNVPRPIQDNYSLQTDQNVTR